MIRPSPAPNVDIVSLRKRFRLGLIFFNIPSGAHKVSKLLGHLIGLYRETIGRSFLVLQSALN